MYTYSTNNANGCDSLATLILTINQSSSAYDTITACNTYFWNENSYTQSGNYTFDTINSLNCDSTAYLNLIINQSTDSETWVTSCDSYSWNGFTYTATGTYMWNGINSMSCDSTAILHLTTLDSDEIVDTISSCYSYLWRGSTYNSSGLYYDTLTNQEGCDSILVLALTINDSIVVNSVIDACDSYSWNGNIYNQSGDYSWLGSTVNGCDSIMYLDLTIFESTTNTVTETVCDSITWNNSFYDISGNYDFVTTNVNGCDSTVTLNLTVNYGSSVNDTIIICYGESFTVANSTYYVSGVYTDTVSSINGCLSTITTNLTVADEIEVYISQPNIDLEANIIGGTAPFYYLWNTQSVSSTITPLSNGVYWLLITDDVPCYADTAFFDVENITTGINEIKNNTIDIYPNPSRDVFNISFTSETIQDLRVRILNVVGEVIISEDLDQFVGEYTKQINLEEMQKVFIS